MRANLHGPVATRYPIAVQNGDAEAPMQACHAACAQQPSTTGPVPSPDADVAGVSAFRLFGSRHSTRRHLVKPTLEGDELPLDRFVEQVVDVELHVLGLVRLPHKAHRTATLHGNGAAVSAAGATHAPSLSRVQICVRAWPSKGRDVLTTVVRLLSLPRAEDLCDRDLAACGLQFGPQHLAEDRSFHREVAAERSMHHSSPIRTYNVQNAPPPRCRSARSTAPTAPRRVKGNALC